MAPSADPRRRCCLVAAPLGPSDRGTAAEKPKAGMGLGPGSGPGARPEWSALRKSISGLQAGPPTASRDADEETVARRPRARFHSRGTTARHPDGGSSHGPEPLMRARGQTGRGAQLAGAHAGTEVQQRASTTGRSGGHHRWRGAGFRVAWSGGLHTDTFI